MVAKILCSSVLKVAKTHEHRRRGGRWRSIGSRLRKPSQLHLHVSVVEHVILGFLEIWGTRRSRPFEIKKILGLQFCVTRTVIVITYALQYFPVKLLRILECVLRDSNIWFLSGLSNHEINPCNTFWYGRWHKIFKKNFRIRGATNLVGCCIWSIPHLFSFSLCTRSRINIMKSQVAHEHISPDAFSKKVVVNCQVEVQLPLYWNHAGGRERRIRLLQGVRLTVSLVIPRRNGKLVSRSRSWWIPKWDSPGTNDSVSKASDHGIPLVINPCMSGNQLAWNVA